MLNLLHRYAIIYFSRSRAADGKYSEDFELLIKTCEKLEYLYNPTMFSEIIKIYLRFNVKERLDKVAIKIFRYFSANAEIKSIFLSYVQLLAERNPRVYILEYSKFFCFN